MDTLSEYNALFMFAGIQAFIILICLIWVITLSLRVRKIRKWFHQLYTGSSKANLEQILERLFGRMEELEQSDVSQVDQLKLLDEKIKKVKGNVGLVRFNAFLNEGSDLSFSIAVVDHEETGFVLTSIYGRDESRVYAKPIEKGTSLYNLTDEEKEAIQKAKEVLS